MRNMAEIAHALSIMRNELAEAQLFEWQSEKDIERRQLELAPPDGWPGKNEAERKAAAAKAYATDTALMGFLSDASTSHAAALRCAANIAGTEDLRRAAEWGIRDRLVAVLSARNLHANNSGNGHQDEAFDVTADEAMYLEASGDEFPF